MEDTKIPIHLVDYENEGKNHTSLLCGDEFYSIEDKPFSELCVEKYKDDYKITKMIFCGYTFLSPEEIFDTAQTILERNHDRTGNLEPDVFIYLLEEALFNKVENTTKITEEKQNIKNRKCPIQNNIYRMGLGFAIVFSLAAVASYFYKKRE